MQKCLQLERENWDYVFARKPPLIIVQSGVVYKGLEQTASNTTWQVGVNKQKIISGFSLSLLEIASCHLADFGQRVFLKNVATDDVWQFLFIFKDI
jgi:hypothetical protein